LIEGDFIAAALARGVRMSWLKRWIGLIVLVIVGVQLPASAQVPPHTPGSICVTPHFWCWAAFPGRPGMACTCKTQSGWVRGVLR
jgi:hypothetical protein